MSVRVIMDGVGAMHQKFVSQVVTRVVDQHVQLQNAIVEVYSVTSKDIARLKLQYLGVKQPTNVLSVLVDDYREFESNSDVPCLIGIIFVCPSFITEEAKRLNKNYIHHLAHMLVHGALHLLHYTHQDDVTYARMKAAEIHCLQALGLRSPY